ncbi:hypothetical protein B4123_4196 [Bacillus paralicheniformis]|uniref:Uncharacterized protein n=1 Tax=Bacillus paralicheniformis TaxID=1648923 RepID=A0ABY3FTD8_9BACI|nr:hypothetical protein LI6934_08215 [Bacillus licheniformis LMG 6934]OLG03474.1 hypothetical protein B4123_4196 [Bacillus paralicheniformis]TWJ59045.1 hypothetical protein CHCC5023_0093 [Bacillus paralicheniformis]TWJ75477.1 hypothetical protein CHCC5019_2148 [Bacillus paralicheniformis]TWJ77079.1 hypothetical protein CHCC20497_0627 [Bacillus paralicheniformis]
MITGLLPFQQFSSLSHPAAAAANRAFAADMLFFTSFIF